jgi:fumarate reductase subunit C
MLQCSKLCYIEATTERSKLKEQGEETRVPVCPALAGCHPWRPSGAAAGQIHRLPVGRWLKRSPHHGQFLRLLRHRPSPCPGAPLGRGGPSGVARDTQGRAPTRKSRWPARLDLLQSASGLFLAVFLIGHMFFVSSILISHEAFYTVARFFEGAYFLAEPRPWLVSVVVGVVLTVFIAHAWLALRKFPANFRQYKAFAEHKAMLRHGDTGLWWIQLWTGFALFFLGTVHLYGMLTQPELIGPYESADRIWTGSMWPLYLLLLFAVEIHGGIGLYRLALKWGWLEGRDPAASRRRLRVAKTACSACSSWGWAWPACWPTCSWALPTRTRPASATCRPGRLR